MTEANPGLVKILDRLEGRILFPEKAAKLKSDIEKNGLTKLSIYSLSKPLYLYDGRV